MKKSKLRLSLFVFITIMTFNKEAWADYERTAESYLSRPVFSGSPITGRILADAARSTYERLGVHVPIELALAQAQLESGMGRHGRNPETNPFNVGEFDAGTKQTFRTTAEGVQAYFDLIAKDYLRARAFSDLMKNFVNHRGQRYASNPRYEKLLRVQINFIRKNFMGA